MVRRINVGHVCRHQVPAREYELQALQIERRRNEELERKLAEEVHKREELIEEQIRLRDRRKLQVCHLAMFTDFFPTFLGHLFVQSRPLSSSTSFFRSCASWVFFSCLPFNLSLPSLFQSTSPSPRNV